MTGDDFGLCLPVNEAIEQAHTRGVLGSASLMVGAPEAADAAARARRLLALRVGLHVVLVRGRSTLSPREVPLLVDREGRFSPHLVRSGLRFFFRPRVREQLEAEIRAQFEAFRRTGLVLDHVDAHNHMHLHPTVSALILRVGREYGLGAVRVPREPLLPSLRATGTAGNALPRFAARLFLGPWIALLRRRLRRAGLCRNDSVFGVNDTGRMSVHRVLRLIAELPPGVSEMYFHPATRRWDGMDPRMVGYEMERELEALMSPAVAEALRARGVERVGYGDLP